MPIAGAGAGACCLAAGLVRGNGCDPAASPARLGEPQHRAYPASEGRAPSADITGSLWGSPLPVGAGLCCVGGISDLDVPQMAVPAAQVPQQSAAMASEAVAAASWGLRAPHAAAKGMALAQQQQQQPPPSSSQPQGLQTRASSSMSESLTSSAPRSSMHMSPISIPPSAQEMHGKGAGQVCPIEPLTLTGDAPETLNMVLRDDSLSGMLWKQGLESSSAPTDGAHAAQTLALGGVGSAFASWRQETKASSGGGPGDGSDAHPVWSEKDVVCSPMSGAMHASPVGMGRDDFAPMAAAPATPSASPADVGMASGRASATASPSPAVAVATKPVGSPACRAAAISTPPVDVAHSKSTAGTSAAAVVRSPRAASRAEAPPGQAPGATDPVKPMSFTAAAVASQAPRGGPGAPTPTGASSSAAQTTARADRAEGKTDGGAAATAVPPGTLVKLRGLPYRASMQDIRSFFDKLKIAPNGIR